jgi:hypothetical protein
MGLEWRAAQCKTATYTEENMNTEQTHTHIIAWVEFEEDTSVWAGEKNSCLR